MVGGMSVERRGENERTHHHPSPKGNHTQLEIWSRVFRHWVIASVFMVCGGGARGTGKGRQFGLHARENGGNDERE